MSHSIHCDICSGNAVLNTCQKLIFPKYGFITAIDKGSGFSGKIFDEPFAYKQCPLLGGGGTVTERSPIGRGNSYLI